MSAVVPAIAPTDEEIRDLGHLASIIKLLEREYLGLTHGELLTLCYLGRKLDTIAELIRKS